MKYKTTPIVTSIASFQINVVKTDIKNDQSVTKISGLNILQVASNISASIGAKSNTLKNLEKIDKHKITSLCKYLIIKKAFLHPNQKLARYTKII